MSKYNKASKRKVTKRKVTKRKVTKKVLKRKKSIKYMGGHENEDLEHYHLYLKNANTGQTKEIPEVFKIGKRSRNISSADVNLIKIYAAEKFYLNPDEIFLSWKGIKLEPDSLKLRNIEIDGEILPLHKQNSENPIIIHTIGQVYEHYPITGSIMPIDSGYETDDS